MNGLSDVRLALYSQELCEERTSVSKTACAPAQSRWSLYRHRWTSRRVLLNLTETQLLDIGITAGQAMREGLKPFWRK